MVLRAGSKNLVTIFCRIMTSGLLEKPLFNGEPSLAQLVFPFNVSDFPEKFCDYDRVKLSLPLSFLILADSKSRI